MIPIILENLALNYLTFYKIYTESLGVLSAISFYMLFSKIFLNTKIYRHQLISLFIIFFCSLIFLLTNNEIYKKSLFSLDFIGPLFCFIVIYGYYALYNVLIKIHFETHLNNPYNYMFLVGFFSLILVIPLDLIAHFYDVKVDNLELEIINQIQRLYKNNLFF